jgi:hypothetical protein
MANGLINGGYLKELMASNPDAGTKVFNGIKDEDSTYTLAGLTSENMPDGGGNIVRNMQPKLAKFVCTCSSNMLDNTPGFEYLQACMNSLNPTMWTFTNVNGVTYSGSGVVDGDVELSGNKSTMQFTIVAGGDGFVQQ